MTNPFARQYGAKGLSARITPKIGCADLCMIVDNCAHNDSFRDAACRQAYGKTAENAIMAAGDQAGHVKRGAQRGVAAGCNGSSDTAQAIAE